MYWLLVFMVRKFWVAHASHIVWTNLRWTWAVPCLLYIALLCSTSYIALPGLLPMKLWHYILRATPAGYSCLPYFSSSIPTSINVYPLTASLFLNCNLFHCWALTAFFFRNWSRYLRVSNDYKVCSSQHEHFVDHTATGKGQRWSWGDTYRPTMHYLSPLPAPRTHLLYYWD